MKKKTFLESTGCLQHTRQNGIKPELHHVHTKHQENVAVILNILKKICKAVIFCWSGSKFAELSSSDWSARIAPWKVALRLLFA